MKKLKSQLDRLWIRFLSDLENPGLKCILRREENQVVANFATVEDPDVPVITYSFEKSIYEKLKTKWK